MGLQYPPFGACSAMVAASRNAPPLRWGARGTAVALLQGALIQLGFPLPYSTLAKGVPDGLFGDETFAVLKAFQEKHKTVLKVDGVAVTDEFIGEFHRQGLAQEFDCVGSFRRSFSWKAGTPIASGQMHAPGERG
jgi:hypothetical protein